MDWLPLALVALVLLGGGLILLRRRRRRTAAPDAPASTPGEEARRLRQQTALSELRDMREALGPAAHSRVERRRNPQPGSAPKIERRKKGARRPP
jgi:LPXTG-motif cell wall-anchored protein